MRTGRGNVFRVPVLMIGVSILLLALLAVFVVLHRTEAERFTILVVHAQPGWLLLAVALQVATYVCAGGVWNAVIRSAGHRVRLGSLARFSVEKLSIDQLIPLGGVSGNLVVFQAMRRLGLPHRLAMEALLVDVLSHYLSYALMALTAVVILWMHHSITPVIVSVVAVFAAFLLAVPALILWLLAHRESSLPAWLMRVHPIAKASEAVRAVSAERIYSPRLAATATAFGTGVFVLDAATLWSLMHIIGNPVSASIAFVALVVGSMAGTVSFLPGGIGGFEAGCVLTLHLLGAPIEAALTGTLLLRGLSLWLPLVPGLIMVRHDILSAKTSDERISNPTATDRAGKLR